MLKKDFKQFKDLTAEQKIEIIKKQIVKKEELQKLQNHAVQKITQCGMFLELLDKTNGQLTKWKKEI